MVNESCHPLLNLNHVDYVVTRKKKVSHPLGGSTSSLYRPDQLAGQVVHYHHPRCDCARSPRLDDNSFCTRESDIWMNASFRKKIVFFSYGSLVSSRRKQVYDTMTIRDLSLELYYT